MITNRNDSQCKDEEKQKDMSTNFQFIHHSDLISFPLVSFSRQGMEKLLFVAILGSSSSLIKVSFMVIGRDVASSERRLRKKEGSLSGSSFVWPMEAAWSKW